MLLLLFFFFFFFFFFFLFFFFLFCFVCLFVLLFVFHRAYCSFEGRSIREKNCKVAPRSKSSHHKVDWLSSYFHDCHHEHSYILYCYIKVSKIKPMYQQMTLSTKLGVLEISTLWHFRLPLLIQMFIKVASFPRLSGIGMPSPIL